MSPTHKPLITIVGALSKQGRSATRSLLESGNYRVRALARRVDLAEAQSLAQAGAELMNVPLELGQKQMMVRAFEGSHGAFLMTPPIAPPDIHEAALGRELADAAVQAGVQHLVFSSLENVDQITHGKNSLRILPTKRTLRIISAHSPCKAPSSYSPSSIPICLNTTRRA